VPPEESNDTPVPFLHTARRPVSCRHSVAWSVRIEYTRYSSSAASDAEPNPRPQPARDTSDVSSTSPCPSVLKLKGGSNPLVKLFKQTEHWNGVSAKSTPLHQPIEQWGHCEGNAGVVRDRRCRERCSLRVNVRLQMEQKGGGPLRLLRVDVVVVVAVAASTWPAIASTVRANQRRVRSLAEGMIGGGVGNKKSAPTHGQSARGPKSVTFGCNLRRQIDRHLVVLRLILVDSCEKHGMWV
jgi:hypothetical protein